MSGTTAYILEALLPAQGYRAGALITDPGTIALIQADPAWPASFRQVAIAAIVGAGAPAGPVAPAPVTVALPSTPGTVAAAPAAPAVSALSAALLQVPALVAAEQANATAIAALTSGLPHGVGTAPSGPTTIATPGTYQTLFAAGTIHAGAYVQNPPANRSFLYVDTAGATGSTLASTSQQIAPGQVWSIAFLPSNDVTVFSPDPISFIAGTY